MQEAQLKLQRREPQSPQHCLLLVVLLQAFKAVGSNWTGG
jgi:hypothetical protein